MFISKNKEKNTGLGREWRNRLLLVVSTLLFFCISTANAAGLIGGSNLLDCQANQNKKDVILDFGNTKITLTALNGWQKTRGELLTWGTIAVKGKGMKHAIDLLGSEFHVGYDCSFIAQLTGFPSVGNSWFGKMTDMDLATPHITLGLASGKAINEKAILDGSPLKVVLKETQAFFWFDYHSGLELAVGDYKISTDTLSGTNTTRIIIDPFDPMFYIEGAFLGGSFAKQEGGAISEHQWFGSDEEESDTVAIGVSLSGFLGYKSALKVPVTSNWESTDEFQNYEFDGHLFLQGPISLGATPISLDGIAVINFDANDDGHPFGSNKISPHDVSGSFFPILQDMKFGYNGTMVVEFEENPLNMSIDIGETSLIWNSSEKAFIFAANTIQPTFNLPNSGINYLDSILKSIWKKPDEEGIVPDIKSYGYLGTKSNGLPDFKITVDADKLEFGGVKYGPVSASLFENGLEFAAEGSSPDMGTFNVYGLITNKNCKLKLKESEISYAGVTIKAPEMNICKGLIAGIKGLIEVSGEVYAAGKWVAMEGETYVNQAGKTTMEAYNQTMALGGGTIEDADMLLSQGGLVVKNGVAKFGNKAKVFALNKFSIGAKGLLSGSLSSSKRKTYNSGTFKLASGGAGVKKVTGQLSGTANYTLKADINGLFVNFNTRTKYKGCVKFGFKGKNTTKCDSFDTSVSGKLDLNGCFRTPAKNFKVGTKILKRKFSKTVRIPSKKICLF
jgi:hypothetical protein